MSLSTPSEEALSISRRGLLKVGAVAGGGLLVGFSMVGANAAAPGFAPNAFIRIGRDGLVTLIMPNQEMGQGIHTAHSQLLAEELDVPMARVRIEQAPADDLLYGGERKRQSTGGSSSIRAGFYPILRQAGADARALLVMAAARGWGIDPAMCRTEDGRVFDDANKRDTDYGALVDLAARLPAPTAPAPLKAPGDFRLIGKSVRRVDTPAKVNGQATYGIDVFPGKVKVATLVASPVVGGKVRSVDDTAALAVPGVRQIVVLEDLVAVVGDHMWAAIQGMKALAIVWNEGSHAAIDSNHIWSQIRRESAKEGINAGVEGDGAAALAQGDRVDAAYEMPFLAHAPMEPLNCTVQVSAGKCELWVGTQVQTRARADAAKAAGLEEGQVTVNNYMLGGAFGRRLDTDMISTAVRIATEIEGPVKVVWTREEDMRHDMYRPVYRNVMSASLKDGRVHGWTHRIAGASVQGRMSGKPLKDGLDKGAVDGAIDLPYDIPHRSVDFVRVEPGAVQVGYWRGVGPNNSIFAVESFVDELATKTGADPVQFRLAMLDKTPRLAKVLRLAAAKSGWGSPLGPRTGRGVAIHNVFGSFMATVAEVEVDEQGDVRVRRFISAVDAGVIVNPNAVIAQIEGGLIFGLSAALFGDVTVARGRIVQSNFHDYRVLRINEAPPIEVHIVRSEAAPGGIGEPGTTAVAPSLANAIAAATGIRLRRMPIDRNVLAGGTKP